MRLALVALLFLAACTSQPEIPGSADHGRLVLLAPLRIPPASASVRLQYGQAVARNGVREYDPFCVFEIDTVSDGPQIVQPDRFRVTRVSHSVGSIADALASGPGAVRVVMFNDEMHSHIYFKTLFHLRSEQQPAVRQLTCMSNQNVPGVYPFMRHLTLQEIDRALGATFRLELR